jgi:4-carboxymuconolactone decarboxylase
MFNRPEYASKLLENRQFGQTLYRGRVIKMSLSAKEIELVAIGSSIGGNCIPCLEWHYKKCVELGFSKAELKEAIDMAKKVKEVPNQKIYETAEKLVADSGVAPTFTPQSGGCCCSGSS